MLFRRRLTLLTVSRQSSLARRGPARQNVAGETLNL